MSLHARIMYDHEVEELEAQGSLGTIPLVKHLFSVNPSADPEFVLYTAEEHIRKYGVNAEYPSEITVPPNSFESEAKEESVNEHEEPASEESYEDLNEALSRPLPRKPSREHRSKDDEVEPARRNLKRSVVAPPINRDINVRGVLDDLDTLDL